MKKKLALVLSVVMALSLTLSACGSSGSSVYATTGGYNEPFGDRITLASTYNLNMPYWLGRYHGILTETGEPGTTVYKMVGSKLKNGKLKYTRIGDTEDFADLLG